MITTDSVGPRRRQPSSRPIPPAAGGKAVTPISQGQRRPQAPLDIRRARMEDMSSVARLVRSSADWYRPILDEKDMTEHDVDDSWAERNFRIREFYLACVDGRAVGTVSVQRLGDYAYLGYIYLDVDYVGRGIGQRLMTFAERVARDWGVKGLALIAHPEATWAKRAYLKYGFEIAESSKQCVLNWQDGALKPYYEEGFELYLLQLDSGTRRRAS